MKKSPIKKIEDFTMKNLTRVSQAIFVTPGGFEPPISRMKTLRPGPLDDGALYLYIKFKRFSFKLAPSLS